MIIEGWESLANILRFSERRVTDDCNEKSFVQMNTVSFGINTFHKYDSFLEYGEGDTVMNE